MLDFTKNFRFADKRPDVPIIESALDTDFYEDTMGQVLHRRCPKVPIKMAFTNRTKSVRLADHIDIGELKEQLDHVRDNVRFTNSDLHFLRGTNEYGDRMFGEDYLTHLKNFRFPDYHLEYRAGQIELEFSGDADLAYRWEMPPLAIISQLYNRSLMKNLSRFGQECVYAEGQKRLAEKIALAKKYPGMTFTDFGTRRRFSRQWHEYVVSTLSEELPRTQFRGTSNTYLAMKLGLEPMGTNAHKMPMIYSALYYDQDSLEPGYSQRKMLEHWWEQYGVGLSIFLPDTYGSDFFLRVLDPLMAMKWKGFRHDSGDPFAFGEKIIKYYESLGINSQEKLIVFSDGLDIPACIRLYEHFAGRIGVTFGIGTNLSNDLGLKNLSIVIKAVMADGHPLVKLSDNLEKAIGNPYEISRWQRLAGYGETFSEACRY